MNGYSTIMYPAISMPDFPKKFVFCCAVLTFSLMDEKKEDAISCQVGI
jgi:hypothetical protein